MVIPAYAKVGAPKSVFWVVIHRWGWELLLHNIGRLATLLQLLPLETVFLHVTQFLTEEAFNTFPTLVTTLGTTRHVAQLHGCVVGATTRHRATTTFPLVLLLLSRKSTVEVQSSISTLSKHNTIFQASWTCQQHLLPDLVL